MDVSNQGQSEQAALWNGASGRSWVEAQELLDRMFMPLESLLVEAALAKPRKRVLDIGCGTGAVTLALKRRLGKEVECVGVDISAPMLDHARSRAERDGAQVSFIRADAEHHAFETHNFDLIVSRFGVMFFADSVRAFENLRRAARADAQLCLIAWRSASENPFMTAAERAVASLLPEVPPRDPDAPGQFNFGDPNRVQRIFEQSGWTNVEIRKLDVECSFATRDLSRYLTRLGPIGRFLQQADERTKKHVLAAALPAFDPYVHGGTVRFNAACWQIGTLVR